jgi:hypothetical protein
MVDEFGQIRSCSTISFNFSTVFSVALADSTLVSALVVAPSNSM